jgi:hypothetical protein
LTDLVDGLARPGGDITGFTNHEVAGIAAYRPARPAPAAGPGHSSTRKSMPGSLTLNSRPVPGSTILTGSPADFGKLIADETEKWAKVIRAANIKAE